MEGDANSRSGDHDRQQCLDAGEIDLALEHGADGRAAEFTRVAQAVKSGSRHCGKESGDGSIDADSSAMGLFLLHDTLILAVCRDSGNADSVIR